MLYKEGGKKKK